MQDLSTLIVATANGTEGSADRLFELLYGELRSMASAQLQRKDRKGLLSTTTLVNESYLRFLNEGALKPEDQGHFMAYASHVMRSIVIDVARRHLADKRGAGQSSITLDTDVVSNLPAADEQLVKLHESLEELAELEPRLGKVVEMRFFGGLREEEIALALGVSLRTVQRDWEKARALLTAALKDQG